MLFQRYFLPAQGSYFLFGPRGTGKSTWLQAHYPGALYLNLLKPDILRQYIARPEHLEAVVNASDAKQVIIDEIQKAPELLSVVHDLIEQKQNRQFILTGSSARKLKRAGVDLLAGRAVVKHFHPFMASELGQTFSLQQALKIGLVPLVVSSENRDETLKAYISLYLEEEVKAEGLVRNIGDFARFLGVMTFSQGQPINASHIARECGVSRKVIEGYLSVLNDLLISHHLPVFTTRAKRKLVSSDKFYYFDVGVYQSLRPTGYLDKQTENHGFGLEGLILQHLRAWNDYLGTPYKLYYWRTKHGVEVDFIVYGPDGFYAIEVKHASTIDRKALRGLKTFADDYPEASLLLLYNGKEKLKIGKVLCMPITLFLQQLSPHTANLL